MTKPVVSSEMGKEEKTSSSSLDTDAPDSIALPRCDTANARVPSNLDHGLSVVAQNRGKHAIRDLHALRLYVQPLHLCISFPAVGQFKEWH